MECLGGCMCESGDRESIRRSYGFFVIIGAMRPGCVASRGARRPILCYSLFSLYDVFQQTHIAAYIETTEGAWINTKCLGGYTCLYTLVKRSSNRKTPCLQIRLQSNKTPELPICRNHPDLHRQAVSAAAVAGRPDTPGNHPEAAAALAAAEAVERYVRASVAVVVSRRLSGSPKTFVVLESSGQAFAVVAAVAVAAARTGRNRQRQRAYLWSGGCLRATRSRLCRVLAGCPSSVCGCCEGGLVLGSRRRVEVRWDRRSIGLRRLAVVLACVQQRIVVGLVIGLGRLRG